MNLGTGPSESFRVLIRIGIEGELRKIFVSKTSTEKITFQETKVELTILSY